MGPRDARGVSSLLNLPAAISPHLTGRSAVHRADSREDVRQNTADSALTGRNAYVLCVSPFTSN